MTSAEVAPGIEGRERDGVPLEGRRQLDQPLARIARQQRLDQHGRDRRVHQPVAREARRMQQVLLLGVEADERVGVRRHAVVAAGGSRQPATVRQLRREELHLGEDRVAVVLQPVLVAISLLDAILVLVGKVWL